MIVRMIFKDPDTPIDAIHDAAKASVDAMPGLSPDEREVLVEKRQEALSDAISPWLRYGEYCGIEFDTDAKTARVLKAEEWK